MKLLTVAGLLLVASPALATPKPSVKPGLPSSKSPDFDAKAISAVLDTANAKLVACYAKGTPLTGLAEAAFTIGVDGKVGKATVRGAEVKAGACMQAVIGKLVFGRPAGGAAIEVIVPISLENGVDPQLNGGMVGDIVPPGGFGKGGTSWGTIGTSKGVGRYGTIGHGNTNANVPSVSIGQPTTNGDLDKAIIRRYIKRNFSKIEYCYEKALVDDKTGKLHGDVVASFTILATGLVDPATATATPAHGMSKDVADCVAEVIEQIEFPKPKGGGVVKVSFPFSFLRAGK